MLLQQHSTSHTIAIGQQQRQSIRFASRTWACGRGCTHVQPACSMQGLADKAMFMRMCTRAHAHSAHGGHGDTEAKLGPHVLSSKLDMEKAVFTTATVIRNDALNVENSARLVYLSIPDNVELLYGRKVQGVLESQRWIDSYTMAGQFVAVKLPDGTLAKRLYSIASTPYESRRDSSYCDASLIEVVAERAAGPDDAILADLGPGSQIQVSQVVGRGFSSLLSSTNTFQMALEEGRPLLCIAVGTRGIVPIRALLSWTPVLAHATASKVSCLYATKSVTSAAFVTEWDAWREAGVNMQLVYSEEWDVDAAAAEPGITEHHTQVVELLEKALFLREGGFNSLAGSCSDVVVLLAGMTGDVASSVSKKLTARGINHERILFADFF